MGKMLEHLKDRIFRLIEECKRMRMLKQIHSQITTSPHLPKTHNYFLITRLLFVCAISDYIILMGQIGVNTILSGYLSCGDFIKAEKIYDLMCQKKYDIDAPLMKKLDYVLSLRRKVVRRPASLKLTKEQREILVGMLLGGLQMESDEERKNHVIHFEFNDNSG